MDNLILSENLTNNLNNIRHGNDIEIMFVNDYFEDS